MARLAVDPAAFIRPSPASGTLGGVAAKTRETMLLCEAAGYDVVIVETVGVGQSETAVADMTDFFLLLMVAGAGDELQGMKKGVVELADMIAVNKADGDNIERAKIAAAEFRGALNILTPASPTWSPPVITYSALTGNGVAELWAKVLEHKEKLGATGELRERRRAQQVKWMWTMLEERLTARLRSDPAVRAKLKQPRPRSPPARWRRLSRSKRSRLCWDIMTHHHPHHRLRPLPRRAGQSDDAAGASIGAAEAGRGWRSYVSSAMSSRPATLRSTASCRSSSPGTDRTHS